MSPQALVCYFGAAERYHPQTRMTKQDPEVTMQMVEVYNELIKDLLRAPDRGSAGLLNVTETAEKGVHAKVCVAFTFVYMYMAFVCVVGRAGGRGGEKPVHQNLSVS